MNKTTALGLILTVSMLGASWGCQATVLDIGADTTTGSTATSSGGTGGASTSSTGTVMGGTGGATTSSTSTSSTSTSTSGTGGAQPTGGLIASRSFGDGVNSYFGRAVAADAAANVILVSDGVGTVDFGGGGLKGPGVFVTKLDPSSKHVWSKGFSTSSPGNAIAGGAAVDSSGNISVTGNFLGSIDFGGGALQSTNADVFVAKLTSSGAHLWSQRFGGPYDDAGRAIACDPAGNVLVAGGFNGSMSIGGNMLTSAGVEDAFLAKLDGSSGAPVWSKRFGNAGSVTRSYGVTVDATGNVLVAGTFSGSVDFGGGVLTSAGGTDIFVAKLSPTGTHIWSRRFGDASDQAAKSIAVDGAGNAFVTGYFAGSVDFGGGPLTSAGGKDIFVAKLDPAGAYAWAKRLGDASDQQATSVTVDGTGNILLTGEIAGQVDFGDGPLAAFGAHDIFVAKVGANGVHLWAKRFGNAQDNDSGTALAVDNAANVLVTGKFTGTVDFGGGPLTSGGGWDMFFAKFAP
jgi:hypothetical protein